MEPFGSERKTAAGFGEMITCDETKETQKEELKTENAPITQVGGEQEEKTRNEQEEITEHLTSLTSVKVPEKEIAMDNMVSSESNATKQLQDQAAYPLLTLEREETVPTSSTGVNGTPKDSITPYVQLGAEAKSQENYKNEKELECNSKEAPEESRSRETQAKVSDLMHVPVKETSKMEENFAEEREDNDREEEGIQQTRERSSSEDTVIVEISRDADIKVQHKKHQNILSGVGSKVKHSIAKVTKAITGKSSKTKPSSPK